MRICRALVHVGSLPSRTHRRQCTGRGPRRQASACLGDPSGDRPRNQGHAELDAHPAPRELATPMGAATSLAHTGSGGLRRRDRARRQRPVRSGRASPSGNARHRRAPRRRPRANPGQRSRGHARRRVSCLLAPRRGREQRAFRSAGRASVLHQRLRPGYRERRMAKLPRQTRRRGHRQGPGSQEAARLAAGQAIRLAARQDAGDC